jgi:hypothetical protein
LLYLLMLSIFFCVCVCVCLCMQCMVYFVVCCICFQTRGERTGKNELRSGP